MSIFRTVAVPAATGPAAARAGRGVPARLGGAALLAAPVLLTGGMIASPPQTEPGSAGYIASLAADPSVSLLSANLLHYGWVAMAVGALAAIAFVRPHARGRVWVLIAAIATAIGSIQLSGLLLSDWFLIGAGTVLPIDDAVAMDAAAKEGSAAVWLVTAQAGGILGTAALALGLARARVLSWWIAPLAVLPFVVQVLGLGPIAAVLSLLAYSPILLAGGRLVADR